MAMPRRLGFTLIEMLMVILVLAVLLAIAIPLYLRSVHDSERRTCRANMQVIAHAEQAHRVRSQPHVYTEDLQQLIGLTEDLTTLPRCPNDRSPETPDYTVTVEESGGFTVHCACDDGEAAAHHNRTPEGPDRGFTPGLDAE
jgi:type IV pilus assembly protein PilA